MVTIVPVVGVFVASVVSGVVYADAARRRLPRRSRLRWTLAVGLASLGGFLLTSLFDGVLNRVYLHGIKSAPVVTAPREILLLHVTVGTAITAGSVLVYGFGSRSGLLQGD